MAEMKFNLLEVDFTAKKHKIVEVTKDVRNYLGGRGLGAKLLWDRVPPGADPFSPENILYIGVGPGTGIFGSVANISAKSPLTLLRGHSNVNGCFGVELIHAGFNAGLLLTGRANKPVYLYIKDDIIEIRSAGHLWGKPNVEVQQLLYDEIRKELGDQNFRIASIGPAGEHLVRNAGICHDFYHHAARFGMGAVMGSKNVKAIVLRGTKVPNYVEPGKIFQMISAFFHQARGHKASRRRWGLSNSLPERYYLTREGVKNKQLGWDDICDQFNPIRHEQQYKLWNDSCTLCPVGCKVPYMRRDPPLGPCVGELRHDNAGGWGANVMIPGYDTQVYLTPFVDNLGLDSEDISGVIAWVMECYDKGLMTKEDLDGIDLTWGNLKAICKMLTKIAHREGIGDTLAEGLKFASQKIGKQSDKYAMTHKGVAITSWEPRGSMSDAVNMALNPVGEQHGDRGSIESIFLDSLTCCRFLRPNLKEIFGSLENYAISMLRMVCGWQLSTEDMADIALRAALMERCYCIREGYLPERDDWLPERFFTEVVYSKYGEPRILDRNQFLDWRQKMYASLGVGKNGIPSKETLSKLKMDFVIPVIEKRIPCWE